MAAPFNLNAVDSPILEQTQFGPDMKRWLSDLVDIVNNNFIILNQAFTNLITSAGIDVGGAGAGPLSVSVVGLTSSGYVNVTLISSSNPVSVLTVTPGTNAFDITFSADPGASAIIVYQAYIARPQ